MAKLRRRARSLGWIGEADDRAVVFQMLDDVGKLVAQQNSPRYPHLIKTGARALDNRDLVHLQKPRDVSGRRLRHEADQRERASDLAVLRVRREIGTTMRIQMALADIEAGDQARLKPDRKRRAGPTCAGSSSPIAR